MEKLGILYLCGNLCSYPSWIALLPLNDAFAQVNICHVIKNTCNCTREENARIAESM